MINHDIMTKHVGRKIPSAELIPDQSPRLAEENEDF
jgi:hypothetical protein